MELIKGTDLELNKTCGNDYAIAVVFEVIAGFIFIYIRIILKFLILGVITDFILAGLSMMISVETDVESPLCSLMVFE